MKKYSLLVAILLICSLFLSVESFAEGDTSTSEKKPMKKLVLPSSLQVIEEEAFLGDKSLEEVVLPEGVEIIGERAFASSGLTTINLPESLTSIASDTFADTPFEGLTKITNLCPIRTTPLTTNGIEFMPVGDGSYLINGKSEGGANYNLYYNKTALPEDFEAGKQYHLEYNDTSGTSYLRICMYYYAEESDEEHLFLNTYQAADFTIPVEAIGLLIRIRVTKADVQINNAIVFPSIRKIEDVEGPEEPSLDPANLCPVRTTPLTMNGIEFMPIGDGSYLVNGTSVKGTNYNLYNNKTALPEGIKPGKTYRLEYEDTSYTDSLRVCVYWFDESGKVEYDLFNSFYSVNFTIPENAVGLLIRLRVISANVTIDNAVVKPVITAVNQIDLDYPEPMITIIDDDGCVKYYTDLLPLCIEKGISISSAVVPLQIEAREKKETDFWMSWAEIRECQSNGIEILSHTYDHAATPDVESRSLEEIRDTYQMAKSILSEHGIETSILVYSGSSSSLAKCRLAARDVYDFGFRAGGNANNQFGQMNPYYIWRYRIQYDYGFNPDNMKELIEQLSRNGTGWMVWTIHTSNPQWCDAFVNALAECIDYANELGIRIVTAQEGAYCYSWR